MAVLASVNPPASFPQLLGIIAVIAITYGLHVLYGALTAQRPYPNILLVEGKGGVEAGKRRFIANSQRVVASAMMQAAKGVICQIYTDAGPKILLKPEHISEIKSDPNFSFDEITKTDFLAELNSFKPFIMGENAIELFKGIIRVNLTQSLARLTVALSEETALALDTHFPPSKEWKQTPALAPHLVHFVAQLSARAFLGLPICRDPSWLRISGDWTRAFFSTTTAIRRYPPWLRELAFRFAPEVKTLKQTHRDAYRIIDAELQRRRAERREKGSERKAIDTLQWFDDAVAASGRTGELDIVNGQLSLTLAAIHTSSNALTHVLFDLAMRPALVDELRAEIVEVLGAEGSGDGSGKPVAQWQKTSLYRLRLLDSVLKESQRLNPFAVLSLKRVALRSCTLSDGTHIPARATVAIPTTYMLDPARAYASASPPDIFDGHRFAALRASPGEENRWQYVTTGAEHFGFGVGTHSCPGRFFASNELKIALVHALVKYDWRLVGGAKQRPENWLRADQIFPNHEAGLEYRSREAEIVL